MLLTFLILTWQHYTGAFNVGSCNIREASGLAEAKFRGSYDRGYPAYSCIANDNCDYEIHVLGSYESRSDHGFGYHPTGQSDVDITVIGNSSRPLILVLSSYEPTLWRLTFPSDVTIHKVIIVSALEAVVTACRVAFISVYNTLLATMQDPSLIMKTLAIATVHAYCSFIRVPIILMTSVPLEK